jgi:hypothetical protein
MEESVLADVERTKGGRSTSEHVNQLLKLALKLESQKKLDREVRDEAITAAFEKIPESDLIDRAIEKRLRLKGRPETREETKKFYDHLLRQEVR